MSAVVGRARRFADASAASFTTGAVCFTAGIGVSAGARLSSTLADGIANAAGSSSLMAELTWGKAVCGRRRRPVRGRRRPPGEGEPIRGGLNCRKSLSRTECICDDWNSCAHWRRVHDGCTSLRRRRNALFSRVTFDNSARRRSMFKLRWKRSDLFVVTSFAVAPIDVIFACSRALSRRMSCSRCRRCCIALRFTRRCAICVERGGLQSMDDLIDFIFCEK